MSDDVDKSFSIDLDRPKAEALRLKTLAEEKYNSGDFGSAVAHAERARDLHPFLSGIREMLIAFEILRVAAAAPIIDGSSGKLKLTPDYYEILQVRRFSHINSIKKKYKKLALTLHPDRNPSLASEEAFKLVGEAARVLSDKIRRKEYDTRLRTALQSEAVAVELGTEVAGETFSTACSSCRLVHQFQKKYLGYNLICPGCKKTFEAMEVEKGRVDEAHGGCVGKNEITEGGNTRVSARIQERVAKGDYVGSVEKFGLGAKRRNGSVGEVSERSGVKVARRGGHVDISKRKEEVERSGEEDGVQNCKLKKMEMLVNVNRDERVGDGVEEALGTEEVQIVVNGTSNGGEGNDEESMTLSQMRSMVKNKKKNAKKLVEGKLCLKAKETNAEKLVVNRIEEEKEKDEERKLEKENVRIEERVKEREREADKEANWKGNSNGRRALKLLNLKGEFDKEKEANPKRNSNRRRGPKVRNLDVVNATSKNYLSEIEKDKGNSEVLLVEQDGEREMGVSREKRVRRRVTNYGNSELLNIRSSKKHEGSNIKRLVANKKSDLEIMAVEDSDFHDFDIDRRERSFKKGQVWALYDDADAMPRHYALINKIVSVYPFVVKMSWLQLQNNGDEESLNWLEKGFPVSCGTFQVALKVNIRYLNLFSHPVDCERAARELYRIYPTKGSVWAIYSSNGREDEEGNGGIQDKKCYDVVVSLTSYSDIHGLSVAYLKKVAGFRTVFKRYASGANAIVCIGAKDTNIFSHQIPAKKLSGEESSGLPKDCWELDPASLTPQLLWCK